MNNTRLSLLKNTILATAGLVLFAFGIYLELQADVGVAPWDSFALGLVNTFGIRYGTASILISVFVIGLDLLLRQPIGIGMILDTVVVGKSVDLFNWLGWVPKCTNPVLIGALLLLGMIFKGMSQYFYMKAALGCGPRDSLFVGIGKRIKKIPVGFINMGIMATVTLIGWLLGGPIGIGTIVCAFLEGPIMQLCFKLVRFDATGIRHQNLIESMKVLFGSGGRTSE